MSNTDNMNELMGQVVKTMGLLSVQLSNVSKEFNGLSKSSTQLQSSQLNFTNQLNSATEQLKRPLAAHGIPNVEKAVHQELLKAAEEHRGATKSKIDSDDLVDFVGKSVAVAKQMVGNADKDRQTESDSTEKVKEHTEKLDAISKGQEMLMAQFSQNPYLRKINEIHNQIDAKKAESKKSAVGSFLDNFGRKTRGNPLSQMLGGLGSIMSGTKSAFGTAKDLGGFLFGGGLEARMKERDIEESRRQGIRGANVISALSYREKELLEKLKDETLSEDKRKEYEDERAIIEEKKNQKISEVRQLNERMATNTMDVIETRSRQLNPKRFDGYTDDERKYILMQQEGEIRKSFALDGSTEAYQKSGIIKAKSTEPSLETSPLVRSATEGFGSVGVPPNDGNTPLSSSGTSAKVPEKGLTLGGVLFNMKEQGNALLTKPLKIMGLNDKPKTFGEFLSGVYTNTTEQIKLTKEQNAKLTELFSGELTKDKDKDKDSLSDSLKSTVKFAALGAVGTVGSQVALGSMGIGDMWAGGNIADDAAIKSTRALAGGTQAWLTRPKAVDATKAPTTVATSATKSGAKPAGKLGMSALGKGMLSKGAKFVGKKAIPGVGLGVGLAMGGQRLTQGDVMGGSLEIVSGIASLLPGLGTATSALIDVSLMTRDAQLEKKKEAEEKRRAQQTIANIRSYDLNKKFSPEQLAEMNAKFTARMISEEQLSNRGEMISRRNAKHSGTAQAEALIR